MKEEENRFRKGFFISLALHLLIFFLLVLGVGGHRKIPPESSIEVSLSSTAPSVDKKKSNVKTPSNRHRKLEKKKKAVKKPKPKAEKTEKKKVEKSSPEQKTPEKKKEAIKESKSDVEKTAKKSEPEKTPKSPEKTSLKSEKKEVIRNIKKKSILRSIKKTTEQESAQTGSTEANPGIISLVLDVYYKTISKRIQKNLILPPNIDSSIFLTAQVSFYMRENGEIYNVGIEKSSGNKRFDSYCIKSVTDTSPLPPPPNELVERIRSEFFIISCESKK